MHGSISDAAVPGRRAVAAWVLYDWAYGAFTTVVSTFVVATYVTQAVARDAAHGTTAWAAAQAVAGVVIAVLAVPLGAIADRGGRRRAMLALATAAMAAATLGLWFVRPHAGDLPRALALVTLGTVAFEVATVFYNAMLPTLARPGRFGRLSMLAWAAGYGGGLCALALCLLLLTRPGLLPSLAAVPAGKVRACAVLAGLWIAAFGWPVAVFVPPAAARLGWRLAARAGMAQMRATWRDAVRVPALRRFIVARALYTDGLITLFAFGGIYAASRFGLDARGVLAFGIRLTIAAGIGTLGCAFIEDRIGAKATALASVLALAGFGAAVLAAADRASFIWLATALGLFVGPAQAASRSLMAQLAPPGQCAAYFGLFALSGRVTGFLGPLTISAVTAAGLSPARRHGGDRAVPAGRRGIAGPRALPAADAGAARAPDHVAQPDQLRRQHRERQHHLPDPRRGLERQADETAERREAPVQHGDPPRIHPGAMGDLEQEAAMRLRHRLAGQQAAGQRERHVEQHAGQQHRHQQERQRDTLEPRRRHAQHGQHEAAELAAHVAEEDARAGKVERQEADQAGRQQQRGEIDEPAALPLGDHRQEQAATSAVPPARPSSPSMKFIALVANRIQPSVASAPRPQPEVDGPDIGHMEHLDEQPAAHGGHRGGDLGRQLDDERPVAQVVQVRHQGDAGGGQDHPAKIRVGQAGELGIAVQHGDAEQERRHHADTAALRRGAGMRLSRVRPVGHAGLQHGQHHQRGHPRQPGAESDMAQHREQGHAA